jgi:hypothetical protein
MDILDLAKLGKLGESTGSLQMDFQINTNYRGDCLNTFVHIFINIMQRYLEITHDSILFSVAQAQGILLCTLYFDCPQRDSHTVHI